MPTLPTSEFCPFTSTSMHSTQALPPPIPSHVTCKHADRLGPITSNAIDAQSLIQHLQSKHVHEA